MSLLGQNLPRHLAERAAEIPPESRRAVAPSRRDATGAAVAGVVVVRDGIEAKRAC